MDEQTAQAYAAEFIGREIAGFRIESLIDNGKSAAVFRATAAEVGRVALKIFDRSLVQRYGDEQQMRRLRLEKKMGESPHPNIVRIYDSGYNEEYRVHFVAMEFVDAPNLERHIAKLGTYVPASAGMHILRQLLGAARHLERLELVHRDIKPSNIAITSDGAITLLDLGVLRAIGAPSGTDTDESRYFLGTLQYSPPEFLLRREHDDRDGWRAVTIYQIAAVGHDLVTGRPIFDKIEPYARLVSAVLTQTPTLHSTEYPTVLVNTLRLALSKNPTHRLAYANFDQFESALNSDETSASARERVKSRLLVRQTGSDAASGTTATSLSVPEIIRVLEAAIAGLPIGALPRCKVFQSDANAVCALFDDLLKFELGERFEVHFRVEIIDGEASLIRIAALATQQYAGSERDFGSANDYVGICERESLAGWLETVLFELVDQAQRRD